MDLDNGDIVSVRHYSEVSPFKSIILDTKKDVVFMGFTRHFTMANFLEGDPMVFGKEVDDHIVAYGGNIISIDPRAGAIKVKVDKINQSSNKRQFERYPVSLYGEVRRKEERKKHLVTLKDISYYGIMAYSKDEFEENDIMDIDIFMKKRVIFLKVKVQRKIPDKNYFKYGMTIIYENINTMNFMSSYIKSLKQEQDNIVRELKKRTSFF